jgi:hypothetical protein
MKKATSKEFLDLLNDFKIKNNIEGNTFDYYATFKFYKSTFLNGFYDMSLVKTDHIEHPVMIKHSTSSLLELGDERFTTLGANNIDYIPVLKDEYVDHIKYMFNALQNSNSFKSFVNAAIADTHNVHSSFISNKDNIYPHPDFRNEKTIKMVDAFLGLKNAVEEELKREKSNETGLLYYLDNLIEKMPRDSLRKYQIVSVFRGRETNDPDIVMDKLYEQFEPHFQLFKIEKMLNYGRLLNAITEKATIDTPLLNHFIETIKEAHPEWFVTFDESLTHCITDDNAIRAAGIPLVDMTADFDLIDPKSFMATAYPSYTDGFSHISNRFKDAETNFVHLYGDNVFFKAYYHNLHIEQDNGLTYCKSVDSDVAFCLKDSNRKDFITPVLDYLDKNEIVLNLSRDSTLYHHIKKDDLAVLVKSEYPNLVFINDELGYKKLGAIFEAKTYKEALSIYQGTDEQAVAKRIKNKAGL